MSQSRARATRPPAGQARKGWSRRRKLLAATAAAAALGGIVAAGVMASSDAGPAQAIEVSTAGQVELSGTDPITGRTVSLADYAGKPVVINVWGSWCEGCIEEAEDLRRFVEQHPEAQMIGLDVNDTRSGARGFYRRWGWTHPSIEDVRGELSFRLGLRGTPTTFFLDEDHRLVGQILGATDLAGFEQGLAAATGA
ncbi:MAG: TlpA disulfide reductase family protein [Thermoleophilia bacterium]